MRTIKKNTEGGGSTSQKKMSMRESNGKSSNWEETKGSIRTQGRTEKSAAKVRAKNERWDGGKKARWGLGGGKREGT